jgi:hypothetical protein
MDFNSLGNKCSDSYAAANRSANRALVQIGQEPLPDVQTGNSVPQTARTKDPRDHTFYVMLAETIRNLATAIEALSKRVAELEIKQLKAGGKK